MIALLALVLQSRSLPPISTEDVFVSGRLERSSPYDTFRIPAVCRTARGTLLAFSEGRNSVTDQSANVLVLRRRRKAEARWGPLQVVAQDRPASLNNPCVLATRGGRVWLMYQRYPKGFDERNAEPGLAPDRSCLTFVTHSDDDGRTWASPVDISSTIKGPSVRSDASGPGIGIELKRGRHRGRLVFPFNEGSNGVYDAFAVFSDDGGRSWRRGVNAPKFEGTNANENQMAELANGDLYLNARNQARTRLRLAAVSRDGGESWSMASPDPALPDPICQGSVLRLSFEPDVLAFTNPADPTGRRNGTLRISHDGGKSWPRAFTIAPGSFAYSCLCPLGGDKVGVLYESVETLAGGGEGYRIRFATFDIPR